MRLLLTPHAPTDWNAQQRYQGWTNTPLSEFGKRQAALVAQRLRPERIDICHTSTSRRAWETADAISRSRGLLFTADPRLREIHFGAWEGLTYADICHQDREAMTAWELNPMHVAPPDGETLADVAVRVASFLATMQNSYKDGDHTVLVVAHRGSLRVLICLALGLSPSAWWQFRLEPASVSELGCFDKGAVLNFLNDTHHLREAPHAG
jgi:alpha-ribazole phosphatase